MVQTISLVRSGTFTNESITKIAKVILSNNGKTKLTRVSRTYLRIAKYRPSTLPGEITRSTRNK